MSSMSDLIQFELPEDIRSEFKVKTNGQCTCTIRGAQRLVGLRESSLSRQFNGDPLKPTLLAKKLIDKGFNVITFKEDGIPDIALAVIAEHYAKDAGRYCTEEAKSINQLFSAIGVRALIQQSLGWTSEQKPILTNPQITAWRKQGKTEEWIEKRTLSIDKRKTYKETHKEHGCNDFQIAKCTNEVYKGIVGEPAPKIRESRGLAKLDNVRNSLTEEELVVIACAETVSVINIKSNDVQGYKECKAVNIEYANAIGDIFRKAKTVKSQLELSST